MCDLLVRGYAGACPCPPRQHALQLTTVIACIWLRSGMGGLVLVDAGSVTAADCTNAVFAPYMLGCERAEAIAHKSRGDGKHRAVGTR